MGPFMAASAAHIKMIECNNMHLPICVSPSILEPIPKPVFREMQDANSPVLIGSRGRSVA